MEHLKTKNGGTPDAGLRSARSVPPPIVALAGNPNVGKSTVFNALTGLRQHTGNWAGKTVERARGVCRRRGREYAMVDLPGAYSLEAEAADERAARDFLIGGTADCVVQVADATALERNLILTLQLLELTPSVVLCVNLMDEAAQKGVHVDLDGLSRALGIPVVGTAARSRRGLNHLMDAVDTVLDGTAPGSGAAEADDTMARVRRAEALAREFVHTDRDHDRLDRRLDRIFMSRLFGLPVMLALLGFIFWITIVGANGPSALLARGFDALEVQLRLALAAIHTSGWLVSLLCDGIFRTLGWVVSVMLPPMAIFFPLFTLLEDLGYLPRVAFNLDGYFERACACGKQALTMCMGFGCNAAGVIGCRIIDSPRERLIAILTNNLAPCNGRFPTIIALLTLFLAGGAAATAGRSALSALALVGLIALGVAATLGLSWLLSHTVLKGVPSNFALELPPYRLPQVGRVLMRSVLDRTLFVLGRAVTVAAPAGLILWVLAHLQWHGVSLLAHAAAFLQPLGHLMGLDGTILIAFLLGLPANEIVLPIILMAYTAAGGLTAVAGLTQLGGLLAVHGWTALTAICFILFSLMHFPCATTLWTIGRETGSAKWTALSAVLPTVLGIVVCIIVAAVGRLLGLA